MEPNGNMKTGMFFGVQSSPEMDTVIEDTFLRKALIDASIKMEEMLKNKSASLQSRIVSKTAWGLEIEIEMSQPKENKPIIIAYTYRINKMAFRQWIEDHKYLFGGPCVVFMDRGLQVTIPGPGTDKWHKTFANIIVKYADDENANIQHRPNIVESPVKFLVHREIINNHDWIVKCVVE